MTIPQFNLALYDWSDPANPQPVQQPQLQGFAAHVANPANLQALLPALTPPRSVAPVQPAPFFSKDFNAFKPQQPQILPPIGQPAQPQHQNQALADFFKPSAQTQSDTQHLRDLQQSGAGLNGIQNPVARGLARFGDVAASILMPRAAQWIPGTTAHNLQLQNQQQQRIQGDVAQDQARAQAAQAGLTAADTIAQTNQRNAETAQIPITADAKRLQAQQMGAAHGLKPSFDANGNQIGWEPDESSPIYQKQKAAVDAMESQQELRAAQAELARSKNDPNSPAYRQAQQRLAVAQQNANAAQKRATAYYGNYLQGAYNIGLDGRVLPGATQIVDDNGNITVVGTKNQAAAAKAQGNAAQFNDVNSALDGLDASAKALQLAGGRLNNPLLLQAYKEPISTLGQWAQNALVSGKLSPQERDLVTNVVAAREKIQGLRKSAGGSTSDSQVNRLEQLLPGPNTPDFDYWTRQMNQVRTMTNKLGQGVSTAAGGLSVNGRGALNSTPKGKPTNTRTYQGHTYVQGANGQWQLQK